MTGNSTISLFGILYIMELEKLFKEYYRPLCLYALRFTLDTDAAEDIVQECFTALLSHQADKPVPYLYASVRNRSLMWLRSRKPMEELPEDLPMEDAIDRSMEDARLWEAVEKLPLQRRKCLVMSKRDGMSYADIATELGISQNTVRNNISKALDTLRHTLPASLNFILLFF